MDFKLRTEMIRFALKDSFGHMIKMELKALD